jgi:hypothetical protein
MSFFGRREGRTRDAFSSKLVIDEDEAQERAKRSADSKELGEEEIVRRWLETVIPA